MQQQDDNRERNIVIHGLEEETEMTEKERIDKIFIVTNTESCPIAFYRLGSKKPDANRPIMLRMQTVSEKEEFMSKL